MSTVVIPWQVKPHPLTGVTSGKLGIWLFLASEVMLFGALFSSYVLLARGLGARALAHRRASGPLRADRHVQHARADHLERHDGDGVGFAEDGSVRRVQALLRGDDRPGPRLPGGQGIRVRLEVQPRRLPRRGLAGAHRSVHVQCAVLHADRTARSARPAGRPGLLVVPVRRSRHVEDRSRAPHRPDRDLRAVLALRRPGLDLSLPGALSTRRSRA